MSQGGVDAAGGGSSGPVWGESEALESRRSCGGQEPDHKDCLCACKFLLSPESLGKPFRDSKAKKQGWECFRKQVPWQCKKWIQGGHPVQEEGR